MASQPPRAEVRQPLKSVAPAETLEDERQLVAAVLRKDRKATSELVSRYADGIYAYVRHRLAPRDGEIVKCCGSAA